MRGTKLRLFVSIGLLVLVAATAGAQTPTGVLKGRVSSEAGPMEGVEVTISSDAMQGGSRTATTTVSGDYLFRFLPPGDYEVVIEKDQFGTQKHQAKVSVAQTAVVDARLMPEVTDVVEVTAAREVISADTVGATTFEASEIDLLAVDRDIEGAVLLAPGTTDQTVSGNASISGAPGHESLYLVDGVDNRETVRGGSLDLYIEDALEETTVLASGISAEYGRFSGGVVNVITKSGGNEFSGSFRASLTNQDWQADTPLTTSKTDEINARYEATIGGRIVRDRLWFFLAGRDRGISGTDQLVDPNQTPFDMTDDERRYELKLTGSISQSHQLTFTHLEFEQEIVNLSSWPPVEFAAVHPGGNIDMNLDVIRYTGVLGSNFFIEAQYAERDTEERGFGSREDPNDLAAATPILHYATGAQNGNTPLGGCGSCEPVSSNQDSILLKASWFASSDRLGSHDIVFGYEDHTDGRVENLRNSPTGFWIYPFTAPTFDEAGNYQPVIPQGGALIIWNPIFLFSTGTNFETQSAFVNDTWRLNKNFTFNLGVRYDSNLSDNGVTIVGDDQRFSPRLGMTWDLSGDGEWIINASLGRYTSYVNQNVPGMFSGPGALNQFVYIYLGPTISGVSSREAVGQVMDAFNAMGGVAATSLWVLPPDIAGQNVIFDRLDTPVADEITVGVTKRLGNRGLIRADYVHREYKDFYVVKGDTTTGQTTVTVDIAPGVSVTQDFDLGYVVNDSEDHVRDYDGLHTQFQYALDRWRFGGNYTWSHLRGTWAGELWNHNAGPALSDYFQYPEYKRDEWSMPEGDLPGDSRHKLRAWVIWDAVSSRRHNLSLTLLQSFRSGTPYGAGGLITIDPTWLPDYGYLTPPQTVGYAYTERDAYRTDDVYRTDIALNYSFLIPTGGGSVEIFIQPEVLNVFNNDAVVTPNTGVLADLALFNPYTETPVEGVHWAKADTFGEALGPADYQMPRTYRVSLGIRF